MLTLKEEDNIAETISNLTPIEYSQLMKKVKREQWKMIAYKWDFKNQKPAAR